MLTDLIIKNFAIIEQLHVSFGPGFNVLTGETGAGKSIIIDAVGLLCGDRARPDLIRSGAEEASIEALFDLAPTDPLRQELVAAGLEVGDELVVRRLVSRSGKSRALANGSLTTLAQLQPWSERLVTIHGQHEHQSLLRPEAHLDFLDHFAGLGEEVSGYRRCFDEAQRLRRQLEELETNDRNRRQRLDLLEFQSQEIATAQLRTGEDEELLAERLLLQNAERLFAGARGGFELLYAGEGAVCERIAAVAGELSGLAKFAPELGDLAESTQGALYTLEDVAQRLRDFSDRVSFEPQRLAEIEERLAQLTALKRKYGPTLADVMAHGEKVSRDLAALADLDASRSDLEQKCASVSRELKGAAAALGERRRQAAELLGHELERELQDLAMGRTRFEVRFTPLDEPGPRGSDRIEFFLSPNPGEAPAPLARIASGGELSRIMLALTRLAPAAAEIPTLIFDEVDAGVGGAAATAVGEKLRAVARGAQVICITHLPQVAAFADRHYRVEKVERDGRTQTVLALLSAEERVQEMARLLGGARITDRTLEHARELISSSSPASPG